MSHNPYKTLFLRQSYLDSYEMYRQALQGKLTTWDYVVLTASNEMQAKAYEEQLAYRLRAGVLPADTKYAVVPDPEGKRVGSGGATLAVLRYIAQQEGTEDFSNKRILCIHSGGDSKRVPQYSACGKIFSPVPRALPDGRRSTLFDEFIFGMAGIPGRISSGMLVCSGDVLVLFNPLQMDFHGDYAAALSVKENVDTGKDHGVFLGGTDGFVKRFLHKQTVQSLQDMGAVDKNRNVDLDTGAVIFSGKLVNALYALVDTPHKFRQLVNEKVRLSFYGDFLYPLAQDSTLEAFYEEKPEGSFCPELTAARQAVWAALHAYKMKLIRFSPAAFLHFGTTRQLHSLMTEDMPNYRFLDWSGVVNTNYRGSSDAALYNAYIGSDCVLGKNCYIEDSDLQHNVTVGEGCIISGVTLKNVTVPPHCVLHGPKLAEDRYVCRMYAVTDNPKENSWLGRKLDMPLWEKPLFAVRPTMDEAVQAALTDNREGELLSLKDSFNQADVTAILPWQDKLSDKIAAEGILEAIKNSTPVEKLQGLKISERVQKYLLQEADRLDMTDVAQFSEKIRIYYYIAKITGSEQMQKKCFATVKEALLSAVRDNIHYDAEAKICKDEVVTRLPVRVNWGGGWSDTPPYCMEHGGTVLNAAISLNGQLPIEVTLRKLQGNKIILASTDIGSYREFECLEDLQNCSDPYDSFALHKAALIACGVIPLGESLTMEALCKHLGGGFYMNTRVIDIPQGSGLGTSSILAGACVRGIFEFLGKQVSDDDLYTQVLCMEQLMSTGGGWQDQVGGLKPGVKLVTAQPALAQRICCTTVKLSAETLEELHDRFVLIYTGQRRLARNLLREVMGKYIGNRPESLDALQKIRQVALQMQTALEQGNVDRFAELLNIHWELSKQLDQGCTNTCIDQIFLSIDDMISGKMICGAGGGGFLQVVMKKGVTAQMLEQRLYEVFADSGVSVRKCEFV